MIILLDLNYTLVANSIELRGKPIWYRQQNERYRQWLVEMLRAMKPEHVVLLTIREEGWKDWSLKRIKEQTGWVPDDAVFNYTGRDIKPEVFKEQALREVIFPKYGEPSGQYIAVESNLDTHKMYAKYGIVGLKAFPTTEAPSGDERAEQKQQPALF